VGAHAGRCITVGEFVQRWHNQLAFAQPRVATDEKNSEKALRKGGADHVNPQTQSGTGQVETSLPRTSSFVQVSYFCWASRNDTDTIRNCLPKRFPPTHVRYLGPCSVRVNWAIGNQIKRPMAIDPFGVASSLVFLLRKALQVTFVGFKPERGASA
jgi:hypothetical protein